MYQSQLRVSRYCMRKWRQWMKWLNWSGNEFKNSPPSQRVCANKNSTKLHPSQLVIFQLCDIFFTVTLFRLFLPCVASALLFPTYSSSLVPVWFWLLRCRQCWQVKQQGRWAGSNAKLLACLKRRGKGKKTPLLSLWRIFWQVVWFPQETFALKWEFPQGNAYVQKLPVSLLMVLLYT